MLDPLEHVVQDEQSELVQPDEQSVSLQLELHFTQLNQQPAKDISELPDDETSDFNPASSTCTFNSSIFIFTSCRLK